jgi:thiol-disulfide isomerase/thioredoxin
MDLTDDDFAAAVRAAGLAVVDFHAGWSAPCVLFKPVFKRVAAEFPHVGFFVVDTELAPIASRVVPTGGQPWLVAYRDGVEVASASPSEGSSEPGAAEARCRSFVERIFGRAP